MTLLRGGGNGFSSPPASVRPVFFLTVPGSVTVRTLDPLSLELDRW